MEKDEQNWAAASGRLSLGPDRVDVWRIRAHPSWGSRAFRMALLSAGERERAGRFVSSRVREAFILAHGALRLILSRYLGVAPGDLRFGALENGKPVLAGRDGPGSLEFNLSHTDGCALLAVASDRSVGLDVERIRGRLDPLDLARRFFAPGETKQLRILKPGGERRQAFFRCWTLKEAYLKLKGEGLPSGLHRFEVEFPPGGPLALLRTDLAGEPAASVHLTGLPAGGGYAAALAVDGPPP
ncbi:MAG: 4'-phosphopantetheinyl transferase family protein, partial [Acidobacteriota bacterium]